MLRDCGRDVEQCAVDPGRYVPLDRSGLSVTRTSVFAKFSTTHTSGQQQAVGRPGHEAIDGDLCAGTGDGIDR